MRAVVQSAFGGPEVLTYTEVDRPQPMPGQALVRVVAVGVEPGLDVKTRRDGAARAIRLPHVLGASVVGDLVAPAQPYGDGTRVVVDPAITCGECRMCLAGRDNLCPRKRLVGIDSWGGYAEFVAIPERNAIPIEAAVSPYEVASAVVSYGTAWELLVRNARVVEGDVVLVVAAAGSVGRAAAEIAGLSGARVILGGRDPEALGELAAALGALGVIDTRGDIAAQVWALAPGGVDVVVETVGAPTWLASTAVLAPSGRLVCCGGAGGDAVSISLRSLYRRGIAMHFSNGTAARDLAAVVGLVAAGRLQPRVAELLPLSHAAEAHRRVEAGAVGGKVVLVPDAHP